MDIIAMVVKNNHIKVTRVYIVCVWWQANASCLIQERAYFVEIMVLLERSRR